MAQTFTDDTYASNHVGQTDLQNIENNFAALKSSFAGTSAPSNVVGGMPWHDSTARKIRNYANSAWLASLMGDASQKMWVYRNDTCEGWTVDNSVFDVVLGIKGGSQAYDVNGGNLAGSWTVGGLTHAHTHTANHNHQWYDITVGAGRSYGSGGSIDAIDGDTGRTGIRYNSDLVSGSSLNSNYYTADAAPTTSAASTNTVSSAATWRARAAVGTLQYPDLT